MEELIEEIINNIDKFKAKLELISNAIENKYSEEKNNDKLSNIKFIISYLEFLLIKNNILYYSDNEIEGINILIEQNNSQRIKKILDTYIKSNKENGINFDYIHYQIIYDKLMNFLNNNTTNTNDDILELLNKILIYKEEFNRLYNKLNNDKDKSKYDINDDNNINILNKEINKYNNYIESLKEKVIAVVIIIHYHLQKKTILKLFLIKILIQILIQILIIMLI